MQRLKSTFESLLWAARLVVVVPVAVSIVMAVAVIVASTIDAASAVGRLGAYFGAQSAGDTSTAVVTDLVKAVDGYLLGAILLIFAFGLYELFVGKIGAAEASEFAERLLLIRSVDDLKDRLAKVVVLVLVVKFFQQALKLTYGSPLDLLYLALGILLIGGALYLTGSPKRKDA